MKADTPSSYYSVALLTLLAGATLLRGWFAATTELSPDEAYYWVWSTRLAAGYYDHPPAVAWLIWMGCALFGQSELGVRLGALLCSLVTAWMMFLTTRSLTGSDRQSFWLAVLLCFSPIFSVGAVVHTPDAALAAAWSLAVWFALKAYQSERLVHWIGLGLAIGLAALSKMTGFFLVVGLGLFAGVCKKGRSSLARPGPAVCLLVAFAVLLPNLIWNAQHGGGSFVFQLDRATAGIEFSLLGFLSFVGGQAGVVSPLLWVGIVLFFAVGWRRSVRFGRSEAFLLFCFSAPLFLSSALLSMVHQVEANWPAAGYLAALPGMAWVWTGGRWYLRNIRYWTGATLAVAVVFTGVIHLQTLAPFLPLDPRMDPTQKLRGWRELAREASGEADVLEAQLASEGYGPVSELRFYGRRPVLYQRSPNRLSQYDLWGREGRPGKILFLQPKTGKTDPRICERAEDRWKLIKGPYPGDFRRAEDFWWWVCEGVGPEEVDADDGTTNEKNTS